jgi:hypothetical protein
VNQSAIFALPYFDVIPNIQEIVHSDNVIQRSPVPVPRTIRHEDPFTGFDAVASLESVLDEILDAQSS